MLFAGVVATILAGGIWVIELIWLSYDYEFEARLQKGFEEHNHQVMVESLSLARKKEEYALQPPEYRKGIGTYDRERSARAARKAAYHRVQRQMYEQAARNPWLPVEVDPPEPR